MVSFKWKSFMLREFSFFNIWIWLRNDEVIDVLSVLTLLEKANENSKDKEEGGRGAYVLWYATDLQWFVCSFYA